MFISIFDIFKVGIGPSSSHTMGPMVAANRFVAALTTGPDSDRYSNSVARLQTSLYGSLAFTGKGHATDKAILLGLAGFEPATVDLEQVPLFEERVKTSGKLSPPGLPEISFDPELDIEFFYGPSLPLHANGMKIRALDKDNKILLEETYYSIGGGFVMTEAELTASQSESDNDLHSKQESAGFPYPFGSAQEMLDMGRAANLTIAQMKLANEETVDSKVDINKRLDNLMTTMDACVDRGLSSTGTLPGGLFVKRRAKDLHEKLVECEKANSTQPHAVNDWLCVYAMAVNEENACGGRVVTSPTNGAAGVVPAVLRYYRDHCIGSTAEGLRTYVATAAAIGGLIKFNASISGAEGGCQAEVGSASSMAAAGLCAALGGSNEQIENAAEIALEHHLGMTCDPVEGLVQVPCIERNGIGAVKAVAAASLALHGDGTHFIPLDNCIETMRQTGLDMNDKYKETSQGGLAVNLPAC